MVQPKNNAQKGILDCLREVADNRSLVLKSRWFVEEVRPAYNTGGYYDQDVPENAVIVSPFFDTADEAQGWFDKHKPDKGKFLRIRKQNLRQFTYNNWVNY